MATDSQGVKRRIKSVTSMERITNAMRLLSSAKLNKAKAVYEKSNENFYLVEHMIKEIFAEASEEIPDKYLAGGEREVGKTCYIVLTSNKGLCGSFNSNIIKATEEAMAGDDGEPLMVAFGNRGRDHFTRRGVPMLASYDTPPENISFIETRDASVPIIEGYERGDYDKVVLVYTSFVSTLQQEVVTTTLLPLDIEEDPEFALTTKEVEYVPSVGEVFNFLVGKWVETTLYGAIIASATSEHAARRTAMESATDNARDMLNELTLSYNRARQAAITDEIIEVVSGSEAQT